MSPSSIDKLERFGTALSDPIRRQILLLLLDGPSHPSDLLAEIDTSQPNLSNHLACLRGCGLVTATKDGRQVRYALATPRLSHALEDLIATELEIGEHDHMGGSK